MDVASLVLGSGAVLASVAVVVVFLALTLSGPRRTAARFAFGSGTGVLVVMWGLAWWIGGGGLA